MSEPARAFTETRQFKVMRIVVGAGNPLMRRLLDSRLAGPMAKKLLLLRYRGRKSGRTITTPVGYVRDGDRVVMVTSPSYRWWPNFVGGAEAELRLPEGWRTGRGRGRHAGRPALRRDRRTPGREARTRDAPRVRARRSTTRVTCVPRRSATATAKAHLVLVTLGPAEPTHERGRRGRRGRPRDARIDDAITRGHPAPPRRAGLPADVDRGGRRGGRAWDGRPCTAASAPRPSSWSPRSSACHPGPSPISRTTPGAPCAGCSARRAARSRRRAAWPSSARCSPSSAATPSCWRRSGPGSSIPTAPSCTASWSDGVAARRRGRRRRPRGGRQPACSAPCSPGRSSASPSTTPGSTGRLEQAWRGIAVDRRPQRRDAAAMTAPILVTGRPRQRRHAARGRAARGSEPAVRVAAWDVDVARRAFGDAVEVVPFDFTRPETFGPAFAGVERMFLLRPPQIADVDGVIVPALARGPAGRASGTSCSSRSRAPSGTGSCPTARSRTGCGPRAWPGRSSGPRTSCRTSRPPTHPRSASSTRSGFRPGAARGRRTWTPATWRRSRRGR